MSANGKPQSPPKFTDGQGRDWTVNLTLGVIDHIQDATGVDLLQEGDTSPVLPLLFDRRKLGRVLWAAIEKQATVRGVASSEFLDALDGDILTAGWGALADALIFFTPSQSRDAARASLEAQMAVLEQGAKAIAEVATSGETTAAIRAAVTKLKEELKADLPKALAGSVSS